MASEESRREEYEMERMEYHREQERLGEEQMAALETQCLKCGMPMILPCAEAAEICEECQTLDLLVDALPLNDPDGCKRRIREFVKEQSLRQSVRSEGLDPDVVIAELRAMCERLINDVLRHKEAAEDAKALLLEVANG